jgi:hypothetical protein
MVGKLTRTGSGGIILQIQSKRLQTRGSSAYKVNLAMKVGSFEVPH